MHERRRQFIESLATMEIPRLLATHGPNPSYMGAKEDIANALLAREAEVEEYKRKFSAPGAAEARTDAMEAELERQRAASLVEKAAAARALAEKASLAERQKEALRKQLEFRQGSYTRPGPLARAAQADGYARNELAKHPEFSPERARELGVALEEAEYRRNWMNDNPDDEDAKAQYEAAQEAVGDLESAHMYNVTAAEAAAWRKEALAFNARNNAAREAAEEAARVEAAAAPAKAAAAAAAAAELAGEAGWTLIGAEHTTHKLEPGTRVKFGKDDKWIEKVVGPEGTVTATARSEDFGSDPAPGVFKEIWKRTGGRRRKTRRRKTRHHRRSKTSKRA
jgi:hypothetical protein